MCLNLEVRAMIHMSKFKPGTVERSLSSTLGPAAGIERTPL